MAQSESTLPTWDSLTQPAAPPPAEPVVEAPVEEAAPPAPEAAVPQPEPESPPPAQGEPPAVAPEPEKVAAPAETSVWESEQEKEQFSPEDQRVIEALSIPEARKAAKRWRKDVAPVYSYLDYSKPISEVGAKLHELSPSRYTEHVYDLLKLHAKEIFGTEFDEIKAKLGSEQATPPPQSTAPTTVPTTQELTEAEIDALPADQLRARIQQQQEAAIAKARQEVESQFQSKLDDLTKRLDEVTGEVKKNDTAAFEQQVAAKGQELYERVWKVVEDGIRDSGLETKPDDPPRIQALKASARKLLDSAQVESAFDAQEENLKVVKAVHDAMKRGEFANAFREEDNLKVRARAAFEAVKNSAEVKAILDEIAASQSKAQPPATAPIPPVPGSTAGVTLKPPATWDEAVKYDVATA